MSKWVVTIYKPYSKDITCPYATEEIEADDKASATSKAKTRIISRFRLDSEWRDAKIIKVKEYG